MIIPDMQKLYEPYTDDGSTLEMFITFCHKQAKKLGIDYQIMENVLVEAFLDIANGQAFHKTKCRCGCGIDKSSTDFCHEMLRRATEMDKREKTEYAERLRKQIESVVLRHVERENEAYVSANAPAKKPGVFSRIWREAMDRGVVEK